jgi:hypothetical protein
VADDAAFGFEYRGQRFDSASEGLQFFADSLKVDWDRVIPVLKRQLENYLKGVSALMLKTHSGSWPGGTSSRTLSTRTGKALQSIQDSVKVTGDTFDDVQGQIGGIFYLRIQEYGGTITPKKGKYLTVPLPAALDGAGVPLRASARDWEKTFVIRSKSGNLLICRREGKQIVPLYVLVTQVVIPPRLGMRNALETGRQYFVDTAVAAMLKEMRNA